MVAVPALLVLLMAQSIMIVIRGKSAESATSAKSVLLPVACDSGFKVCDWAHMLK